MKIGFENKTVLVTGATRGIGKQIAQDFAMQGAKLILTGTKKDQINKLNKSAQKDKKNIKYYCVDFSERESLERFLAEIHKNFKIDVCVNNAGINFLNYVDQTKAEDWDKMMDVNLRAPYMLIREVSKSMKKNKYGRIINISSIFGVVSREKRSIYTTTKYGIIGMTKTCALELAKYNVLVNALSPGFVGTDLTKKNLTKMEKILLEKQIPMKRFCSPEEISRTVLFLASDLNTYLTGQNIIVDGGFVSA